jgi:hypothetical protein
MPDRMKISKDSETRYKGIVSSDWNECLAPCGPFDPLLFLYPELEPSLTSIFRSYTSNRMSLREATRRIRDLVPLPVSAEQMDGYLAHSFSTYRGVPTLIEECTRRDLLFMINTTGMTGTFQRAFAAGLLPPVRALAANPLISYPAEKTDPHLLYEVSEITDKPIHTRAVMERFGMPGKKVFLIGDSGGDGPHFEWGKGVGATLIGSMVKPSLDAYCLQRGITLDLRFGDPGTEPDFRDLVAWIDQRLDLTPSGPPSFAPGR